MKFPLAIQNLIDHFSRLPTVGPKTAERYVFYLLKQNREELKKFAQSLTELKEKTTICHTCYGYAEANPCSICDDNKRDKSLLCVVSNSRYTLVIEATGQYTGLYHTLDGALNAIEGVKPEHLNILPLVERIKKNNIREIILALNTDMEGETTAMYLAKILKPYKLKITRLARGLPMGAGLEYADEITLSNALKYRNEL